MLKPLYKAGDRRVITDDAKFSAFVELHTHSTLTEMADAWEGKVSVFVLSRKLKKLGITRKKKTFDYRERDAAKRETFLSELALVSVSQHAYMDENGQDVNDSYVDGWSRKGMRCHTRKTRARKDRISVIAGLNQSKLCAPCHFQGCTDANTRSMPG